MRGVVLFGAGTVADQVFHYLTNDSTHSVAAFAVDGAHVAASEKWGLPVVPAEELVNRYPPSDYRAFVAVGYQELNALRARKYTDLKRLGYELISYVSSRASNFARAPVGDNCLILEGAVIQPCAQVGNDVFVWSNNHVGHHSAVGDHCYIAGHVVISGSSVIGSHCFLGVNATIGHEISIGEGSFIGAGTLITKSLPKGSVCIREDTPRFRLDAPAFMRLTRMK